MSGNRKIVATAGRVLMIGMAVVGLSACGGKKAATTTTSSAATAPSGAALAWSGSVCSALATWRAQVVAAGKAATAHSTKTGVEQALTSAETATTTLKTTLKGLGKPPTSASGPAAEALQELKGELQNDVAVIERTIKRVPASGGVEQATSTVQSVVATMRSQLEATAKELRSLPGGELGQAFSQAPACKSLKASTSS